jgi:hypothetical protein
VTDKPKTPRPIPAEHLCPIPNCGGRMIFTHSRQTREGTSKRRRCQFCGYIDRAILKIEIVRIEEVARRNARYRTRGKKVTAERAISHAKKPKRAGKSKRKVENSISEEKSC